ncbi:MAG: phosphoesterase, PA-phosphatase-like protein [Candidatus Saccharibacteria bacterium]|nr:phosphoesterase, PA-phosphatase-like protein [Candidatus Saccharibacteria bacterium]
MNNTKTSLKSFFKKYKTSQLIVALLLFWTPIIIFFRIAGEIAERQPIGLDTTILSWIHSQANPTLNWIFFDLTTIGNVEVILPITILLLALLLYKKHRRHAMLVFFGVGGAAVANFILKLLFHRDRPAFWQSLITETGYSFPSGHAMLTSALILCIVAILWKTKWRIISIVLGAILILSIGFSRLYLGVHYPTDIVAGWSVSVVWIAIVLLITKAASYEYHKNDRLKTKSRQVQK